MVKHMNIIISDKYEKEIKNIKRCFIVVDGVEYKVTRRIYDDIQIGIEYKEHESFSGYYKFNPNSKYLTPLRLK